jgi:CheY-like chemotaxis protein
MGDATLTGLRVLVVEDEFFVALDLSDLLAGWGCHILGPAASVGDALRIIPVGGPEAALLDINLAGTRSTPVAEALATRGVPFAAVTAYPDLPEPVFAGVPVVAKPYQPGEIRRARLALTATGARTRSGGRSATPALMPRPPRPSGAPRRARPSSGGRRTDRGTGWLLPVYRAALTGPEQLPYPATVVKETTAGAAIGEDI